MRKIQIIMYHYTRDLRNTRYPNLKGMDSREFEEQIAYFSSHSNVLKMEELIEIVEKDLPIPDNSVLLTFDDGYIDNYLVAFPVLIKYKLQGSFFVSAKTFKENVLLDVNKIHFILESSDHECVIADLRQFINDIGDSEWDGESKTFDELWNEYAVDNQYDNKDVVFIKRVLQTGLPEKARKRISSILFEKYVAVEENVFARELYLNEDQIRVMKSDGMFIGVHGYDHYWLSKLDSGKMKEDVDKALSAMKDFIDENRWVMNYPYGLYNDCVIDYVKSRGCVLGLTTGFQVADIDRDNRYVLPRIDCRDI